MEGADQPVRGRGFRVESHLGEGEGDGAPFGHVARETEGFRHQTVEREHPVGESGPVGLLGVDAAARERPFLGDAEPHHLRQSLQTARSGNGADGDFGQGKKNVVGNETDIAGKCQFEPAAGHVTVQCRDHRFAARCHAVLGGKVEPEVTARRGTLELPHLAQVRARAKSPPGTGKNHHTNAIILFDLIEGCLNLAMGRRVARVQDLGAVQRDGCDGPFDGYDDVLKTVFTRHRGVSSPSSHARRPAPPRRVD